MKGLLRWLCSTNAKDIGVMYFIVGFIAALIGTSLSLIIRLELAAPGPQYINSEKYSTIYNNLISMHGIIMIFFFLMPILLGGFSNYFIPLFIGAPDMAFPRLNNISLWLLPPSMLLALLASLTEGGSAAGWTLSRVSQNSNILAIKLHSMRKTPYEKKYSLYKFIKIANKVIRLSRLLQVKMFFSLIQSNGKFAWDFYKSQKKSHQRLHMKYPNLYFKRFNSSNNPREGVHKKNNPKDKKIWFYQWFVGLTDGDGCFSISKSGKNKWDLTFVITQSLINAKVIYYIKKELGYGKTFIDYKNQKISFRIRDFKTLNKIIFPIFDKYPLLTSKFFDYIAFKRVYNILSNPTKYPCEVSRNILIKNLIFEKNNIPRNYTTPSKEYNNLNLNHWTYILNDHYFFSPIWFENTLLKDSKVPTFEYWSSIISKAWLTGFVEAEGTFYLVNKDTNRITHGFSITLKKDKIVLEGIKKILHIPSQIKNNKNDVYCLDNTNNKSNSNIVEFFKGSFKGIKSLQFKIWSRSWIKSKNYHNKEEKFIYLNRIKNLLSKIV